MQNSCRHCTETGPDGIESIDTRTETNRRRTKFQTDRRDVAQPCDVHRSKLDENRKREKDAHLPNAMKHHKLFKEGSEDKVAGPKATVGTRDIGDT